ncbi:MAG: MFS transporter [Candidatus Hodarchaeota archaeon]
MQESNSKRYYTSYLENLRIVFRSRNYTVILFTNYSSSIFLAAWIYLNLYFRDIGISYYELGLADAWMMFLGLFAMMLGGYTADRFIPFRKYMAAFNMFFLAIASFLIPFVSDFIGLIVVWTVFGFSQFCQSSIDPITFEALPSEQMGTGTSLFTLGGIFSILGLVLVGILINNSFINGLAVFWHLFTIIALINFISRLLFLEKTEPAEGYLNRGNGQVRDLFDQYKKGVTVLLATIPLFLIVFLFDIAADIAYNFGRNFYLNEEVGMNYTDINITMIAATSLGIIGGLFAGFFLDRNKNDAKVMFLVYFLLPFSLILLINSTSFPFWTTMFSHDKLGSIISSTAFLAVVIKSGNDEIWRTVSWGAVGRNLPREHTGKVMAILSMSVSVLGVFISPIAGIIYQKAGGQPLLLIAFILNIIILSLLLFGWFRNSRKMISHSSTIQGVESIP